MGMRQIVCLAVPLTNEGRYKTSLRTPEIRKDVILYFVIDT